MCAWKGRHVSHYHYEDKFKDRMGAPGEIAAKKAAEECVAISGMMGQGCPAPVIWKVQHLSQGLSHWTANSARWTHLMWADRIGPSERAEGDAVVSERGGSCLGPTQKITEHLLKGFKLHL